MERPKPRKPAAYFYKTALAQHIGIITDALSDGSRHLQEVAKSMTPPYPFTPFDEIPDAKLLARNSLIVGISLEQTVRDIKNISDKEWQSILEAYTLASSGKGDTKEQRKDMGDIQMSDKMLDHSEIICTYVENHVVDIAKFRYLRTGGTPSHKITTFIAVMHTANRIQQLKAENN